MSRAQRISVIVAALVVALIVTVPVAAAQTDVDPYVEDDAVEVDVDDERGDDAEVLGSQVTPDSSGTLAFSGAEVLVLALVGFGLLTVGGAAVAASRRHGVR